MRNKKASLAEKRFEIKNHITAGMMKTFPAYLFDLVGIGLAKILRLKNKPHWIISAIAIDILVLLPGILVALRMGEITHWKREHLLYLALQPFACLSSIVSHINVTYNVLPGIRDHIVDSILSVEDLDDLKKWLDVLFSFRKWLAFSILFGFFVAIFFTLGLSLVVNGDIIGLGIVTFLVIPFLIAPLYVILHMLVLPPRLSGYHLEIFESDPVNSEIIQHLIYLLNVYLYMVVGYIATGTLLSSLNSATYWWVWASIVIAWLPTILQFLINQYSVRKIVLTAKWRILNRLQERIRELQSKALNSTANSTILRLNQIMDLHDRISAKPNSALNWGAGISFLNQLMLPVLGLLLGNIDKLLK